MVEQQNGPDHEAFRHLASDAAGDPAGFQVTEDQPPAVEQDQDLSSQLSREMNAMLLQFQARLLPQLEKAMDQKIAGAIDGLTKVLAGAQSQSNGHSEVLPPAAEKTPAEKLIDVVLQLAPAVLAKFTGGGAPAGGLAAFEAQFSQMANVLNVAKGTFVDSHMESLRHGMKLTADAYTYAFKATGVVPDSSAFNSQVDGPGPVATPESEPVMAGRRGVDVDAIAKSMRGKLT